jgi:hypothetical protein
VTFLSCKTNARVYDAKMGHGPHSPPPGTAASPKRLTKVTYLQFTTRPVWAQIPDSQPTSLSLPYLVQGHIGTNFVARQVKALSLTSKSLALAYSPVRG